MEGETGRGSNHFAVAGTVDSLDETSKKITLDGSSKFEILELRSKH